MPYISTQEVSKKRKQLKAALPGFKLSIRRSNHSCIDVNILEGHISMPEYQQVNQYYIDEHYKESPEIKQVLNTIKDILSADQSELVYDGDYGSVPNFYYNISIGRYDRNYLTKK